MVARMTKTDKILELVRNTGVLRPRDMDLYNIPRIYLSRLLERGFNQSEEIARILSSRLDIPMDRKSLTRIRAIEPQSGLSLNNDKRIYSRRSAIIRSKTTVPSPLSTI